MARMYAALIGEVDGIRLISPARLREATAVAMSGTDAIFGMPTKWGLGYAIGGLGSGSEDSTSVFGVGGAGGSFACGDTATGIAFAMTKNRLTSDFSAATQLNQMVTNGLRER
jgi:CubicO group peptidase (beta-lactamase class C family)